MKSDKFLYKIIKIVGRIGDKITEFICNFCEGERDDTTRTNQE